MPRPDATKNSKGSWRISGLDASGPYPGLEDKLTLFGQFIGDWDIREDKYLQPDGSWVKQRGEIHFRWILEGRGIQDTFMTYDEKTKRMIPDGTTLRFYDANIDAWRVTWISPIQGAVKNLIGRRVGEEIVLERTTEEGYLVKWIFSEITPRKFRWHAEESRDRGRTWTLREDMQVRRSS